MITSKPVSEARRNRGRENGLGGIGKGTCEPRKGGRYVYDPETRKFILADDMNAKKDEATRGDYGLCRKLDSVLTNYKRFKGKNDRKEINEEYLGRQQEHRDHIRKEVSNFE